MTVAPALLWLLPLIAWLLPWLFIAPRVGVLLAGEMDLPDDPTKSTSRPGELAESRTMPALTRRRDVESRQEHWLIYYGDVHVGTIAVRSGIPHDQPQWGWRCGFYPGSLPSECTTGTAVTFEQARAAFEGAWRVFLSNRTEADFQEWRRQRDWTAEKYRRFDRAAPPPFSPAGRVFLPQRTDERCEHAGHDQDPHGQANVPKESVDHEPFLQCSIGMTRP